MNYRIISVVVVAAGIYGMVIAWKTPNAMTTKTIVMVTILTILAAVVTAQETDTASLTITGVVPEQVDISITPTGNTNLDLVTDVTDRSVAEVNEYANVRTGYTVTVTSANNWNLVGLAFGDTLPYGATYNGVSVPTATATATITDADDRTGVPGDVSGVDKTFAISYSASEANLYSDEYQDTLTFVITGK